MAKKKDWIPNSYELFAPFLNNFNTRATTNVLAWKLNAGSVTTLGTETTDFNTYYAISVEKKTRSSNDVANTKRAYKLAKGTLRGIGIGQMKTNLSMTNEQRTLCGVVNNSGTHTGSPVANVSPTIQFTHTGTLGGWIIFLNPQNALGGKPVGQNGYYVSFGFYAPGAAVPAEAECTQVLIFTKQAGGVIFAPGSMSKSFVGYARYKNTRDELGGVATQFFGTVS